MQKQLSYPEIRKAYDEVAMFWDFFSSPLELLIGFGKLRKNFIARAYGKVLELAVGTGRNFRYYNEDCEITTIDLSPEMLKRAIEKAKKLDRNIKTSVGSAESLDFADDSFDCVVETLALCTYTDPIKALSEMQRVCKKDGLILLLEHGISENSLVRKWQNWREAPHYRRIGCHLTRNPFEIVESAGLEIEESKKYGIGKSIYFIVAKN